MSIIYQSEQSITCQKNTEWEHEADQGVATKASDPKLKRPPLYKVIILNDDYTPMDFVVDVLEHFFSMTTEQATRIMLQVHTEGRGICGVYSKDVAETKAAQVNEYAKQSEHPLLCEIECQE